MSCECGEHLSEINRSSGEIIAEAIQGYTIVVKKGLMTAEEADRRVNKVMRDLRILEAAGIEVGTPILFDTGSTQVGQLAEINRRLSREEMSPSISDN